MKKISLAIFISALAVGLIFSTDCNFNEVKNLSAIQGSGNAKTETRNVNNFTKIDAENAINVEISAQKDFSVTVEADDNLLQNIKTEVNGDTLKIYTEKSISPKTRINVKVSMPEIETLKLSGASDGILTNVKTDSLELKANGASKIKVDGEAKQTNFEASGASKIDAENLKTEDADVDASGASSTTVSATGKLKIEATGASKVTYLGEPQNLQQNATGASSINKK